MKLRFAFTLMEVNLAIFIMATGVLAMVSLYSLGFRENSQSIEDVAAASVADTYLSPLAMALSATNMTWTSWCRIGEIPNDTRGCDGIYPKSGSGDGWAAYFTQMGNSSSSNFTITRNCNSLARNAFDDVLEKCPPPYNNMSKPPDIGYSYGLVVTRKGATISLAFRASRRRDMLMAQPIYYTEVRFQGRDDL